MPFKDRTKANVSRRQGEAKEGEEPSGDWCVEVLGPRGEHLGHFEFSKPGSYVIKHDV